MELRSQNFRYVFDYLKKAIDMEKDISSPDIMLLRIIHNATTSFELQSGFPKYSGEDAELRNIFRKMNFLVSPGLTSTTWCTYAANQILFEMGYDTTTILDTDPVTKKYSIAFTTANEMYTKAKEKPKVVIEMSWKDAALKANQGIPILVAALGKGKNQSHVGIVAPSFLDLNKIKATEIIIGQAGYYNGFGTLNDFFNKAYVNEPAFFELPKKGSK